MPFLQPLVNFGGLPARFNGDYTWIFDDYFDALVYCEVLYVMMVFLGPKFMENRQPMNLKLFAMAWNLALSLFSMGGTIGCLTMVMYLVRDRGFYKTTCFFDKHVVHDGELAFWIFAFLLSKIPEMIDTALLVLQKKPVIFLHWYHHLTVTIFCWYAGYSLIASGLWFATMNYAVHSVMYMYYFLCTLGWRKYIRPFAPLITAAQLLQMVVGTAIVGYTFYYSYISPLGCGVDRRTIRMGVAMYGSYFFLFAILFCNLYLKKGSKGKKHAKISNGASNGTPAAVETIKNSDIVQGINMDNGNGYTKDKKKKK